MRVCVLAEPGAEAVSMFDAAETSLAIRNRLLQDDPRFNKSYFDKENSWEPSPPPRQGAVAVVDHRTFRVEQVEANEMRNAEEGKENVAPSSAQTCKFAKTVMFQAIQPPILPNETFFPPALLTCLTIRV